MSQGFLRGRQTLYNPTGESYAHVTDHDALQVTFAPEGKTAFGESLVGSLEPVIQLGFPYNLNSLLINSRENQSGSVSVASSMLTCTTGAAANSSGTALSRRSVKYEAGFGVRCRFTAKFTTGVADSTQIAGFGDQAEGYFVGYNGAAFGVMRRKGGQREVRTLTITTKSSTAENVTVTLNGDAVAIAVTNGADTTVTANEIAAGNYSDVGRGWSATAVGNTVVFQSWDASARTGTYSVAGTTIVGSFAQTIAGSAPTETWVAQAAWNGSDKFDGNGVTGITLDPTKGNVYEITIQYLGFGLVTFSAVDPDDGERHVLHSFEYTNANTTPHLNNPSLPFYISAENAANTSSLSVSTASAAIFIDGRRMNLGVNRGIAASKTLATANETPVLSFRLAQTFGSVWNKAQVKINLVSVAVEHTKPVAINFYANATLTGASWSAVDASTSTLQKDTTATAATGGVLLFTIQLGKTGQAQINLLADMNVGEFMPGDMITVTALPNSATGAEANVAFNITERL